jgi:hypothetical protein
LIEKQFVWKRDIYFIDPFVLPGKIDDMTKCYINYYIDCLTNNVSHLLSERFTHELNKLIENKTNTEPLESHCFRSTDDFIRKHPELIENCCLFLNWCEPIEENPRVPSDEKIYYDLYAIQHLKPKWILVICAASDYKVRASEMWSDGTLIKAKWSYSSITAGTSKFHDWRLNGNMEIDYTIFEKRIKNVSEINSLGNSVSSTITMLLLQKKS